MRKKKEQHCEFPLGHTCSWGELLAYKAPSFHDDSPPFFGSHLGQVLPTSYFYHPQTGPSFSNLVPSCCATWMLGSVAEFSVPPHPFYHPPSLSEKNNSNWHLTVNLQGTSTLFVNKTIPSVNRTGIIPFIFQEENRLNQVTHVFPTAVEQPWVIDTLFHTQFSHLLIGCSDKRLQF